MLDYLLDFYPLALVHHQQPAHEILRLFRDVFPVVSIELHPHAVDLLLEVGLVVPLEGRVPAKQDVEDDPYGPPVYFFVVLLSAEDLRSHIERGTYQGRHEMGFIGYDLRDSEVNELDDSVLIPRRENTVLGLN